MKIDLTLFEKNEDLKQKVRVALRIPESVTLELAADRLIAINDLARGIADLHPHKRSIATLGALPPPLREVARGFAKQGYTVQEIKVNLKSKNEEQKFTEKIEALKKDTLFVLGSEIEPLTGLFFPWKSIQAELSKKNIFTVNYFNPASLRSGLRFPENGFEAFVIDPVMGGNCFVLKGDRCRTEPLLWGESIFSESNLMETCEALHRNIRFGHHDENYVIEFEKNSASQLNTIATPASITSSNSTTTATTNVSSTATGGGDSSGSGSGESFVETLPFWCARLYDRVVFFVKGVNGDALVQEMNQSFSKASQLPSKDDSTFSTSDPVFWRDPHLNSWLPNLGFTHEDSRTCFIAALDSTRHPNFITHLQNTIIALQKISGVRK